MKNKKIVVVGGVAGGASFAARARRLDEFADIVMFEKGPDVSFSNCSLPFYLSGIVEKQEDLVLMNPKIFKDIYNIDARVNSEVLSIDRNKKIVSVKNLIDNITYEESYDVLILSPGAKPIMPRAIDGIDKKHVFSVRNVEDIVKIKTYLDHNNIQDVAVVGGGFIGIEVAENLKLADKNVSMIEAAPQVLMPLDEDMAQIVHKELHMKGIDLILNDGVQSIQDDHILLASDKKVKADAVIMAIGVMPEVSLAKDAGLELGQFGAISVNHHYQTSDPSIYALGDAIEETHMLTHKKTRLTMAGPAQRQAKVAANHIYGEIVSPKGVIGASILQVFDQSVAFTGLNSKQLDDLGIQYQTAFVIPEDKVGIMPDMNMMFFKLIYAYPSGKVLGAQAIGKGNVDKRIDVISTAIRFGGYVQDLQDLELSYSPTYNHPKDVVNHAAALASNLLNNHIKQIDVSKARKLVESNATIFDTREKPAYDKGHLNGAIHIPVSEFRSRLDEIPKDKDVYLYCQTGVRSYNMARALKQYGYENITNITGSFMGICEYEYFKDQTEDRKPIVTNYYLVKF